MIKRPEYAPIYVVLLNYNGGELVRNCIRSLAQQTLRPRFVLFVDNGSENYDEASIRQRFGEAFSRHLKILRLEQNIGYSRAMNRGLHEALTHDHNTSWVMTLSNDTEFEPDFFEKLLPHLEADEKSSSEKIGMLAPKVKSKNDPTLLDATGLVLCLDGMSSARGQREKDAGQFDTKTKIMMPNGVAGIYKSQLLKDVGLLDEAFNAYCEDTDLGMRAWLAGWDCKFVPEAVLYHARSSTMGEHSLNKLYLVERNHYWVALKNLPLVLLFLNPVFSLYRYWVQVLAVVRSEGQGAGYGQKYSALELVETTIRALIDAAGKAPEMFKQRLKTRKLRRRSFFRVLLGIISMRMRFRDLILK